MSYVNIVMYGAVLPSYDSKKDVKLKDKNETINADSVDNIDKINQFGND